MTETYPPLKIYCINLDSRPDRWEHFNNEIKNTPIEHSVERFPGILAEDGYEGCRTSHIEVIRLAKEQNLPWVGVMEDDCTLYPHFTSQFPTILNELWENKDEWEVYNSGPIDIVSRSRFKDNSQLLRIESCTCIQFIIVQKSAYDKILDYKKGDPRDADHYYRFKCRRKIVTSIPPLTRQYTSKSNVQVSNFIDVPYEFNKAYMHAMVFAPPHISHLAKCPFLL